MGSPYHNGRLSLRDSSRKTPKAPAQDNSSRRLSLGNLHAEDVPVPAPVRRMSAFDRNAWDEAYRKLTGQIEKIISAYIDLGAQKSTDPMGTLARLKIFTEDLLQKALAGSKIHQRAFDQIFPKHRELEPRQGASVLRGWEEIASSRMFQERTKAYAFAWFTDQAIEKNAEIGTAEHLAEHRHRRPRSGFRALSVHL